MQARYYQPIGRFLSPDPVGPAAGNLFNFNQYSYADNNPIFSTDPDGRQPAQPQMLYVAPYHQSIDPRQDPLFSTVGRAIAADVAFVVGAATNDRLLQATAVDAMKDATSGGRGSEAAITLITMGDGGEGEISVAGVKMEPTVTGARNALEAAGYPGKPITNDSGTETGTIHNVPELKTDVRVMDGGPHHSPRIVTTRQGTSQGVHPETGLNIRGNLSRSELNAISHVKLRDKP
jgi:uncharacterized protein RhaS with RHS repeats